MKSVKDKVQLSNGVMIPIVGFGTWESVDDEGYQAVREALKAGYIHIDTAKVYGNEEIVGKAIKDSGIKREDLFITSKIWSDDRGSYEDTEAAILKSLELLGLDYLDMMLIHWPNPAKYRKHWQQLNAETWRAMEDAYNEGRIKAIGVSNFMINHLDELAKTAQILPMVNQIRLCPGDTKDELVKYLREHDITIEAYSPFARGEIFDIQEMKDIAQKHNKTVSQVALRWSLQKGFIPLPKSVTAKRIRENMDIFDFELKADEIKQIDKVKTTYHEGSNNPDSTNF